MKECEDLIDSLVYHVRGAIADYKMDDEVRRPRRLCGFLGVIQVRALTGICCRSPRRTASASCTTCPIGWRTSFRKRACASSGSLERTWLPGGRTSAASLSAVPRSQR